MITNKKIYFASDFHLGAPDYERSLEREKKVVAWLDEILPQCRELYLLGDLFDFWFEYKHAVPKGYLRLLGRLTQFADQGIPIHIFTGNHDLWMRDYLAKELNAKIYYHPHITEIDGKVFYLAHGDGLGPADHGFKFMKKIFVSPFSKWLYRQLHPDTGIRLANFFSKKSRLKTGESDAVFLGEENEWLIIHSKEVLQKQHIDYFVYGHRHFPLLLPLPDNSTYLNLGDWIRYFTYGVWDGENIKLEYFKQATAKPKAG